MSKKIFYSLIILTLLIAIFGIKERVSIEQTNHNVELAFDYNSLAEMGLQYNNQKLTLNQLKNYGVNSIALTPYDIEKLIKIDRVIKFTKSEINKIELLSEGRDGFWHSFPDREESVFLIFSQEDQFYNNLKYLKDDFNLSFKKIEGKNIVFFPFWTEDYLSIDLGFSEELISEIKAQDLNIVYRFENWYNNSINFQLLEKVKDQSTIIFAGEEILGYPNELKETQQIMKENKNIFGFIEAIISVQKGEDKLAQNLNYNLIRVHSVTQEEMNKYSQTKIIDRYLRAVRERDIRFLYLRPIIKENQNFDFVKNMNKNYIESLSNQLKTEGYNLADKAVYYQTFSNSSFFLLISALGILVGGILLLNEFFKFHKEIILYILFILGIIAILFIYTFFDIYIFRTGLALGSSIIFPSLAVITQLLKKDKKKTVLNYIIGALITLTGAIFLISALADISYLTKIQQFRGVKLAFLMPLVIITIYYFVEYIVRQNELSTRDKLMQIFDMNLKAKHLLILVFIALTGIYYILRTGNFPILAVSSIEEKIRVILEKLLYVRPRFKEFLIGHPAFIIALYYFKDLKNNYVLYFLSLLAVVGQLNITNSFAHIHTPVLISLLRTIHGLWLGLLIGLVVVFIIRFIFIYFIKKKDKIDV